MRRDYFTLDPTGVQASDSERPIIRIAYEGPTEEFEPRLQRGERQLDGSEIDITYRLQTSLESDDPRGVLAIADRVTGEYVLELNTDPEIVFSITSAVADGDENETHYGVVIENEDGRELVRYDKSTLLVYNRDGELLREKSLIPSGVEI